MQFKLEITSLVHLFEVICLLLYSETRSHCAALVEQVGVKLTAILLPLHLLHRDHRCVLPCLVCIFGITCNPICRFLISCCSNHRTMQIHQTELLFLTSVPSPFTWTCTYVRMYECTYVRMDPCCKIQSVSTCMD